jgi:hypothetical protein
LFTPVSVRRDQAIGTALLVAAAAAIAFAFAFADDDTKCAGILLDKAQPESPDDSVPEVSSCIGLALGLLDSCLTGQEVSSGDVIRHRLSRSGDRQLNYALHVMAITQIAMAAKLGRVFYDRKHREGKPKKEALRGG